MLNEIITRIRSGWLSMCKRFGFGVQEAPFPPTTTLIFCRAPQEDAELEMLSRSCTLPSNSIQFQWLLCRGPSSGTWKQEIKHFCCCYQYLTALFGLNLFLFLCMWMSMYACDCVYVCVYFPAFYGTLVEIIEQLFGVNYSSHHKDLGSNTGFQRF